MIPAVRFLILLLVAALVSCGGKEDSWDQLGRDKVDYMKEMVEILQEVADGGDAGKAVRKVKKWEKKGDKLVEREQALGSPTSEGAREMEANYRTELQGVVIEYVGLLQRLQRDNKLTPALIDAIRNIKGSTGP